MEEQNPKEIKINIKELEGEPVDLNLSEIEEVEGLFEKRVIHAPDEFSLDKKIIKGILEGFTEGALKNIITLSQEKVRLYKVTEDSISLLSCSDLPHPLLKRGYISPTNFVRRPNCSVQVFGYSLAKKNKCFTLKFDHKSGALLDFEETEFWSDPNIERVRSFDIADPKKPIDQSFFYFNRKNETLSTKVELIIGKYRKNKIFRWMNFGRVVMNKLEEVKKRYDKKKALQLTEEIRRNFVFGGSFLHNFYRYRTKNPHHTLIISGCLFGYLFFLVDLRRKKILKSAKVTGLDIWDQKGIEDLILDPPQRDPRGHGEGQPQEVQVQNIQRPYFIGHVYLPKTGSLLLFAVLMHIKITITLNSIFSPDSERKFKMVEKRINKISSKQFRSFGDDRILTHYSGEVRSTYLRPLAWFDPETLEETKIKGFEEEGRSHLLFNNSSLIQKFTAKLSQNRFLMINDHLAFIYDFEKDKVVDEQATCFKINDNARLMKVDNLYVGGRAKSFQIMRTKKNGDGEEVIEKQKIIHLNDFIPNMSLTHRSFGFKFFKLNNGNYLYVSEHFLEEDVRVNPNGTRPRLVSMEIEKNSLDVVKFHVVLPDELATRPKVAGFQSINNLLMLHSRLKNPRNEQVEPNQLQDYSSLIIADPQFNILDHCTQAKLDPDSPISVIHLDNIASQGLENTIYLHRVDGKEKKLVLLKTLVIAGTKIETMYTGIMC